MSTQIKPIPDGYHTFTPYLIVRGASDALEFYKKAFAAIELCRLDTPDGQEFTALNGGPMFKFSPAISFVVHCETQAEVDEVWAKLSAGGKENQCAWLDDKFGVSWQIVPDALIELLSDPDPAKAEG